MSLFDWLKTLFTGKPAETPDDVADRIERIADRFANAGNDAAAAAARAAADEARCAPNAGAAQGIEADFLRSRGLRPDGRPLRPVFGRGPSGDYVRYGTTLRAGGSRGWRYHNPGYVRCSQAAMLYGALGCDGEYAIFPDHAAGMRALHRTLRDEYPQHTVREALGQHLPPEARLDPDRLCALAGLNPLATAATLSDADAAALAPALEQQGDWSAGSEFGRDDNASPDWVQDAWDAPAEASTAAEPADAAAAPATDNS
jgi:hypothetical protein